MAEAIHPSELSPAALRIDLSAVPIKNVLATVIGNWLETFDLIVYTIFATTIGRQFFPVDSEFGQLLLSFATFGVGYLTRPLGGIIIGAYADRSGRKAALTLTILFMALGTVIIGITPSYREIGLAAPALIVVARLLQGFSAGGEIGAATTFLVELAPIGRRGFYGSWQLASQGLAILTAALMGFGLAHALSAEAMEVWGWRLPFLFGLLIAPVGFYIRRNMVETADLDRTQKTSSMVLNSLLSEHGWPMLIGILTVAGGTISFFVLNIYMITYAIHTLKMPLSTGMLAGVIGGLITFFGSLLGGWLSDRFGRRALSIWPRVLMVVLIYPAFLFVTKQQSLWSLLSVIAVLNLLQSVSGAVSLVLLPECFPRAVRAASLSTIYAVGTTIFGSTASLIATLIVDMTGDPVSLAWYLVAANLLTAIALHKMHPQNEHGSLE